MAEYNYPVETIYGGQTTLDNRADAARQAGFYNNSQRKQDWEQIAQAEGKRGNLAVLAIWLGMIVLFWTLIILGASWVLS